MIRKHIIGAGLAGLTAALAMAPEPVTLITSGTLDHGSASLWSQGGIAAAIGSDDAVDLHVADTIAAGDRLCDPEAVDRIIAAGPRIIEQLRGLGVAFDPGLGLEAAHSRRRIAHVRDHTGLAITQAVASAVRAAPHIQIIENALVTDLDIVENQVAGLWVLRDKTRVYLASEAILIATGGVGALYRHTSNPPGATGTGLALAARVGATLRDLEMVQFHPTGLDTGSAPLFLISEALRGEGAILIDETNTRFTSELAPRDAVSRAVFHHQAKGHKIFLDATRLPNVARHFPTIDAACKASGIDPATTPIPIRPVAHYHMGGIAVDEAGRTNIENLFAAGEAASTGLHGANRLASNSLLEACVTGETAGQAMATIRRTFRAAQPQAPHRRAATVAATNTLTSRHLGVLRDAAGLTSLVTALTPYALSNDAALIALMMAIAALDRTESRGAHTRTDHPHTDPTPRHTVITLAEALSRAATLAHRHAA